MVDSLRAAQTVLPPFTNSCLIAWRRLSDDEMTLDIYFIDCCMLINVLIFLAAVKSREFCRNENIVSRHPVAVSAVDVTRTLFLSFISL